MGADERAIPILEPKILHSLNMTHSNESIVLLCGKAEEIFYDEYQRECLEIRL